jgi:RNA polymerase sigma factor (sigma-70 family)
MAPPRRSRDFGTTHWSVVSAVRSIDKAAARRALDFLCKEYWDGIYSRACLRIHDKDEAQDVTQAFFLGLIVSGALEKVRPENGMFRSFLTAALRNFINKYLRDQQRLKRGGGHTFVPLDPVTGSVDGVRELADPDTPESIYRRDQAKRYLQDAVGDVERLWRAAGDGAAFDCLEACLRGEPPDATHRENAATLGITEDAVKQRVRRGRLQIGARLVRRLAPVLTKTGILAGREDFTRTFRR